MSLLRGFRVSQIGPGLAAAVCGRLLADVGAEVACLAPDDDTTLGLYLNQGKSVAPSLDAVATAQMIIAEGDPTVLRARGHDAVALRRINPSAALVFISPYGQTGPDADVPATDLTLFYASFIARLLTGQVDDLAEAPIRPVGEQSAFIGGLAGACAGMHAALGATPGAVADVSIQEALATLVMTELARAGLSGRNWGRKRNTDGNGATVCILPARDGYAAISPREEKQWVAWLEAMGFPEWGNDPRFAKKPDRVANWDALHALMSDWSRQHNKQALADLAQEAHVPSFPLREPAEHFLSLQLAHRGFWRDCEIGGTTLKAPGAPFGLTLHPGPATPHPAGPLPLSGIRVLDFSWVIAGPTTTRTLAAMGAEVIKVEAPGRGDPGRASETHTVLGQAKRGIVLDLKKPEAIAIARKLALECDVLVENFATGVMDRLGLGADDLRKVNPNLIYISASGLGRTGPEAQAVAYGTLLQCYAGFAGLNRHPERAPRVGMAWLDPMCGLMLGFITAAALWQRQHAGGVARVDFSMVEAMLWTMADPLLATQINGPAQPVGNHSALYAPHNAYRCAGVEDWVALSVTNDEAWRALCGIVPALANLVASTETDRQAQATPVDTILAAWFADKPAPETAAMLQQANIAAAALAGSATLVVNAHLTSRAFWDAHDPGVLPGLPWRMNFLRQSGPPPGLGADTDAVLRDVLHIPEKQRETLRQSGAFGA